MLSYDDFKNLGKNKTLKSYQRVGFQDSHRKTTEKNIFPDVFQKMSNLKNKKAKILDIGCGCSKPVVDLIKNSKKLDQQLVLIDSKEQLDNLKNYLHVKKYCFRFPEDEKFIKKHEGFFDVIIVYSVIHHVFHHQNYINFIDVAVGLLSPGGQLLIADIPNISVKNRFLDSSTGKTFHKKWSGKDAPPVQFNKFVPFEIDDSIVISIIQRYRLKGFNTYLLPQNSNLPLCNTREDILITKL